MKTSLFCSALVGLMFCFVVAALAADPQLEIAALRREIAHHDELYHHAAAPEISDFEYDQLKRRLAALEREIPEAARAAAPLPEIGDDRSGLFPVVRHRASMLSLDKAYTEAETRAFIARAAKALGREAAALPFMVEPKFDGIAVNVTFERGRLVRAATRGNGAEGDDITAGTVDVVVTDGFTGNVALKTAEGTAKLFSDFLKAAIRSSWLAKFGMLFAKPVLSQVMARADARRYNGALFVGLNGVVVKSHGGTDAVGFANAIGVAVDMIARDLNAHIGEELARMAAEQAQAGLTQNEPALAAGAGSQ